MKSFVATLMLTSCGLAAARRQLSENTGFSIMSDDLIIGRQLQQGSYGDYGYGGRSVEAKVPEAPAPKGQGVQPDGGADVQADLPENCVIAHQGMCEQCEEGTFKLNFGTDTECIVCADIDPNCDVCNDQIGCAQCKDVNNQQPVTQADGLAVCEDI